MTAYVIYQAEILDPDGYEAYKASAASSVAAAGGRYIVRGGQIEVLEGDAPEGRTVVVEFPTMEAALRWYRSDEYTSARRLREQVARARMYVVDGIE